MEGKTVSRGGVYPVWTPPKFLTESKISLKNTCKDKTLPEKKYAPTLNPIAFCGLTVLISLRN